VTDDRQLDLGAYFLEKQAEKQAEQARQRRRAFIVFATDPEKVGQDDYKLTFACEAATQSEAENKVRSMVGRRRRVAAYLASGKYKNALPEARWVA
jgi:hypothetical protein